MKLVQINTTCGAGSTGKICVAVSELLNSADVENYIFYTFGKSEHSNGRKYMNAFDIKFQSLKAKVIGNYGFQSKAATKRLIAELERISPNAVHLHNLHGHNIHLGELFTYFRNKRIKIFWTFHDCWAFTGYCPHYDMVGCDKWKNGCRNCPQRKNYSLFFDRSERIYEKKKMLFREVDLTVVTPSQWLANQVNQSFLKDFCVKVINNGSDLSVFCPQESNVRKKYNIEGKFVVLGVAFGWGVRKGLDVFIELSNRLDERFRIVLVGTNSEIDKKLPDDIISIHRTNNQMELAEIYTAADVFVNPTREENFPTTHMESLACGTPVIAFNTGGCNEMLDETCGLVVEKNDVNELTKKIIMVCENRIFSTEACVSKAKEFDQNIKFNEYITLYERAFSDGTNVFSK